jgi:hypothetical protein
LPAKPPGQDTALTGGHWLVGDGATLDLPEPIEIIAAQATVSLDGLSSLPDLGAIKENRGFLLLSGNRPGISGPGGAIVNKGTIQMDGDVFSLQVFETPIDQRSAGRIIVKNGTLQVHGVSGATRDFRNPGLLRVEGGTLSLDLDEGAQQGSLINTGTIDIRENGVVTIDGAMRTTGSVLTQIGNPFRGHVVTTRDLEIDGGILRATFVGENYFHLFSASIFVVGSLSVTGSFTTFNSVNLPSGFASVLLTQFGVQVRLEEA